MRGSVPLHAPTVHCNNTGKENGKERDKENDKAQEMFVGEVAHKCQRCSTSDDTIVKSRVLQSGFSNGSPVEVAIRLM